MRRLVAVATLLNALASLLPQLTGLVALDPHAFGQFSLVYLAFAFATSVGLSVVCEAWHTLRLQGDDRFGWRPYSTTSVAIAAAAVALAAVLGWVSGMPPLSLLFASLAVGASAFRVNARYYFAERGEWRRVLGGEITFVIAYAGVLTSLLFASLDPLLAITAAWAAGAVASFAFTPPAAPAADDLSRWFVGHRREIPRLLSDSLLMDIGAVLTPLLIAPLLGVRDFGTYRAVSNVAAPVRLLLNPLRPQIAKRPGGLLLNLVVIACGVGVGLTAGCVLMVIGWSGLEIGVLTSLAPLAPAVGISVAANFVSHFFYIRTRTRATARVLLTARVTQTVAVTCLPLLGALRAGLTGAIWGLALAGLTTALIWWLAERRKAGARDD